MKAVFYYPARSSFVKEDERILGDLFQLKSHCLHQNKGKTRYLLSLTAMFIRLILSAGTGLSLCWFADYHALVMVLAARFRGMKSVLFVGGYDAVHYPEYAYGVYHNPLRRFCAGYALRHCDLIIANHQALLSSDNRYYNPHGHPEGIYRLVPGLKTRAVVVENCVTTEAPTKISIQRKKQILCVGSTPRFQDFYNKGYDLLLKAVEAFPDWHFVFVGLDLDKHPALSERYHLEEYPNLRVYSSLEHSAVLRLMNETDIYIQASISEGMPNALMEAMLCGCKVLGSNVAGIPTIIGEYGEIIMQRSSEALLFALRITMNQEPDRAATSQSTAQRFSRERRTKELSAALQGLV